MALVMTIVQKQEIKSQFDSNKKHILATAAFDASYPTNGETVILSQLGIGTVDSFQIFPSLGNTFAYNSSTNKILAYVSGTGAEVANAVDLSAQTAVPCVIVGSAI